MRGQRLVQGRCNGEVVYEARNAAVCANGSINHHYSTEPSQCRNIFSQMIPTVLFGYVFLRLNLFYVLCTLLSCNRWPLDGNGGPSQRKCLLCNYQYVVDRLRNTQPIIS